MKKTIITVMLIFFLALNISAQNRGFRVVAEDDLGAQVQIGKQWAVFIAIDKYREWAALANPVKDARELRNILVQNYFIDEVRELYNEQATAENIRRLFADLRRLVEINDSVFVFYAGHGYTDELTKSGSWIPTDGGKNEMAQANWLPNIQVRNMLTALAARHVFLIADACFSGDILDISRGSAPEITSDYYRRAHSRVSRQVMTSGSSESVPDASEFALRLKSSLLRAETAYVDPEYIYRNVREVRTTQPLLGVIRGTEHQDGGSHIFFKRNPASPNTLAALPAPLPPATGQGAPRPLPTTEDKKLSAAASKRLWSVGASVGSAIADPRFVGTVRGTLAPIDYLFFEVGLDLGLLSGDSEVGYWHLYPYGHATYYYPLGKSGIYAGAGAGFLFAEYSFPQGKKAVNSFALDLVVGGNIFSFLDVSYTFRTSFKNVGHKVSVGYIYRFK